jgi:hypothetical protein
MLLFKSWYERHQYGAVKQSRNWELIVATIVKILPSIQGAKNHHWFYNPESCYSSVLSTTLFCYSSVLSTTLFWDPTLLLQNQFRRTSEKRMVLKWRLIDIKQGCSKLREVITIYSSLRAWPLEYYNNVFHLTRFCNHHGCVVIGNGQQNYRTFVTCIEIRPAISILHNGARTGNTHTQTHTRTKHTHTRTHMHTNTQTHTHRNNFYMQCWDVENYFWIVMWN